MVPGGIRSEHHPSEVAGLTVLARSSKRRESHRTSIVADADGGRRAEIIVPLESIEVDSDTVMSCTSLRRWIPRRAGFRNGHLPAADDTVSVVLDDFMFVLYIGGVGGEVTGTHDGAEFIAAARAGTVDVYVVEQVDVRRSKPDDFDTAARAGHVLGASVSAYLVQTL